MIQKLRNERPDNYERPNQTWILQKELVGDEVVEIRRLSLRAKRKIATLAITSFTIGSLLILLNSPSRNSFLAPGPLNSAHAQLLADQGADKCAACHDQGNDSFSSWAANAFIGTKQGKCQSDLCMDCHKKTIAPRFAMNPHNVDPLTLIGPQSKLRLASVKTSVGLNPPVNAKNELSCNVCHREHNGDFDLTAMTDQKCQSCHENSYHRFETDHPEFTNWPNERRSRIAFDHSSHGMKHFPGKSEPFNCSQCHVDDVRNNVKTLAPFEISCANCHNRQIIDSGDQQLTFFELPMLDLDAIRNASADIGQWPISCSGDFDGKIPPMMRLLLGTDKRAKKAFGRLGQNFDFADLDPDDERQIELACQLVWSIKYLLYDLSLEGHLAVRNRLETVLGRVVSDAESHEVMRGLNEGVFQSAAESWLPDLTREVTSHRYSQASKSISWLPDGEILARIASPDDHLAPNPLHSLINSNQQPVDQQNQPPTGAANGHAQVWPSQPVDIDDIPEIGNQPLGAESNFDPEAKPPVRQPRDFESWLSENPLKGNLGQDDTPTPVVEPPEFARPQDTSQSITKVHEPSRLKMPFSEPVLWQTNHDLFRISYRPRGHADPIVKAWTDLAVSSPHAEVGLNTGQLFKQLTSITGVGLCRSCHTVDRHPDHSFSMNWVAEYRDPTVRSFTRFSHGPHLIQPHLQDCKHCHDLDPQVSNYESFQSFEPAIAVSNFKSITKFHCASCHTEGRTDNSCTQCHNYHIGSKVIGTGH